jgi:metal-responsive CopG/Arc/MetJ family transcriptional regulator
MSIETLTISIDENLLKRLDQLVKSQVYLSLNQAIEEAIAQKISQLDKLRLAQECDKLDKTFEQTLADEGLGLELEEWPEY